MQIHREIIPDFEKIIDKFADDNPKNLYHQSNKPYSKSSIE